MNKKFKNYTGDGLAFYTAISTSGMANADLIERSGMSQGKFYGLYKKEIIDNVDKAVLARALNKTVEEIFGSRNNSTEHADNLSQSVDNQPIINKLGTKIAAVTTHQSNDQDMMHAMIEAQRDYAIAAKEAAMAARLNAETNKRLVAMLERGMLEGSVKQEPAVLK